MAETTIDTLRKEFRSALLENKTIELLDTTSEELKSMFRTDEYLFNVLHVPVEYITRTEPELGKTPQGKRFIEFVNEVRKIPLDPTASRIEEFLRMKAKNEESLPSCPESILFKPPKLVVLNLARANYPIAYLEVICKSSTSSPFLSLKQAIEETVRESSVLLDSFQRLRTWIFHFDGICRGIRHREEYVSFIPHQQKK